MEKITVDGLARLPAFCHAVRAGDFIYVSGTLGTVGASCTLIEGGVGPQTTQILENFKIILSSCDATLDDIVKINVYISDMNQFGEMNEAYLRVMGNDPPARITVGRAELALNAALEMDCVAYKPK